MTRVAVDGWPATDARTFLLPCERWWADAALRVRRVSPQRALAWLAACAARTHPAFTPSAIITSGASLLAYQLEPALAVLAGRRRVLLADVVGLGKTVQAALIIAEIRQQRAEARVLVLAPASLLSQWSDELETRFSISAGLADAGHFARLRANLPYLSNPWQGPGVWIASPDYLKQAHVREAMPRAPFDLVVIDEAHTVAGPSQRHSALDAIARTARHVVLLTATPHDGDETRFNRLLSIGSTGAGADSLVIFRRTRTRPARRARALRVNPGEHLSQVLAVIDAFARTARTGSPTDGLSLICSVFRKRALSSMAALMSSIQRRLAVLNNEPALEPADTWTQPGLAFEDGVGPESGHADVMPAGEWSALRSATGLPGHREQAWLQRLLGAATRARMSSVPDPKLARVTLLLTRSREPVVVFTEYRDSLLALADALRPLRRVAVLHGGLAGSEQRRVLGAFLSGSSDTLLATDVASQGLNLQHRARWVVHFDRPWTPMRLEQRVGRVDRIGQTQLVHVTHVSVRHPADDAQQRRVEARQDLRDAAPLPNCRRWARVAEGLARLFARQRALAARWRGPDPLAVPRARVTTQTLRRLGLESQAETRTIVEVPLVTDTGEVIERHLAWQDAWQDAPPTLARRARALSARARWRHARLHAAQFDGAPEARLQPGLFDPQALTARPQDARDSTAPAPSHRLRVGQPRPLLMLERRR